MAIHLPSNERPRERLLTIGEAALSDAELVAALLGTGTRGASALEIGEHLIARFGGVSGLARAKLGELKRIRGVGVARACALAACLELGRRAVAPRAVRAAIRLPRDVYELLGPHLARLLHEVFHVLCLDRKHRLLRDVRVAEGGRAHCSLTPADVFSPAIQEGSSAVIFVHNHPSGDPFPSSEDLELTSRLKAAATVLGITALDHIVIGDGRYISLVEQGRFGAL